MVEFDGKSVFSFAHGADLPWGHLWWISTVRECFHSLTVWICHGVLFDCWRYKAIFSLAKMGWFTGMVHCGSGVGGVLGYFFSSSVGYGRNQW